MPVPGDPISIRNAAGSVVAHPVSAQDGSFQATVPVGRYSVTEGILGMSQSCDVRNQTVSTLSFILAA